MQLRFVEAVTVACVTGLLLVAFGVLSQELAKPGTLRVYPPRIITKAPCRQKKTPEFNHAGLSPQAELEPSLATQRPSAIDSASQTQQVQETRTTYVDNPSPKRVPTATGVPW